jgi:hypothetical protein
VTSLLLKRASASRSSGEWNDDDFDVLADGVVVGRNHAAGKFDLNLPLASHHSIISSARASSVGGTVRRSAFAVLRLSADFCQTLDACHIFSSRPAQ